MPGVGPRESRVLALLLLFGVQCLVGCATPGVCGNGAGADPIVNGADAPTKRETVASVLVELAAAPDPAAFAHARGFSLVDGKVRVVILFADSATEEEIVAAMHRHALTLEKRAERVVRVLLLPAELQSLAGEPSVVFIDLPSMPGK